MAIYALTTFIGAFLLFQVQPLIGKYILPWFGGGPGVWTACMLFFQLGLLAGYAYAHLLVQRLRPRTQAVVHLTLLALALLSLPIIPAARWKPNGDIQPMLQILAMLSVTLGLPYLVLSTTGPLIQQWFNKAMGGGSPYRLYALSNAASLLALLTYPFYVEPNLPRKTQATVWGIGFVIYVVCCGICAVKMFSKRFRQDELPVVGAGEGAIDAASLRSPKWRERFLWIALPACASMLLLAVTNKLCQDVAVIPFLWIVPLALYLLSFIICFDSARWYLRMPFALLMIAGIIGIFHAMSLGSDAPARLQILLYGGGLFSCCMVCHGELYRLRPAPRRLTGFYLSIAAGGALGGIFVGVIAPLIFRDFYELELGLLLCPALFLFVCLFTPGTSENGAQGTARPTQEEQSVGTAGPAQEQRIGSVLESWRWLAWLLPPLFFAAMDWFVQQAALENKAITKSGAMWARIGIWTFFGVLALSWILRGNVKNFRHWRALACAWLSLGIVVFGLALWSQSRDAGHEKIFTARNFYGVLSVYEHNRKEPESHHFLLQHGKITHGLQFTDPTMAQVATSYYAESSGVGLAVRALPPVGRRIGVVGLGTGTMAVYGQATDYLRIYEINPQVKQVATSLFSYVSQCPAPVDIIMGDARLSMEREEPQHFDLLVLDAFSSDAIPVHLLTREAFELYQRHLNPDAIIAVHISNLYLNLEPVVANLATRFRYEAGMIDLAETEEEWWVYASSWILLTRNKSTLELPQIRSSMTVPRKDAAVPLWTDDFAGLFQILRK